MSSIYDFRIKALRETMGRFLVDACYIPTADPHNSEYVSDRYKDREYLTGFTGSAGTLLVTAGEALLWTDGRYFVQAENELSGSDITLCRSGERDVPDIFQYIENSLPEGAKLGFNPDIVSVHTAERLKKAIEKKGGDIVLLSGEDMVKWPDRPDIEAFRLEMLPPDYCGETVAKKLASVRESLSESKVDAIFISALEEVMWLFNVRGGDIPHNPVAYSYALVDMEKAFLFVRAAALHEEVSAYLEECGVTVREYEEVAGELISYVAGHPGSRIACDHKTVSYAIGEILEHKGERVSLPHIISEKKAVKHERELAHIREVYLQDSLVLTRFIRHMKEECKGDLDEYGAARMLDDMRRRTKGCLDLSFETISAYGANGAMMHYSAPETGSAVIEKKGFYLVDSGGQYLGGTTDVTRTLVMGPVTYEERRNFTAVVNGMLRLQGARFLKGTTGRNLDVLARGPLWDLGIDYKCGTGHGIGYMLGVHEGPHSIRHRFIKDEEETALVPGMLVSDEPGVYIAGHYGIRIENILEVCPFRETADGEFYCFKPLTLVPIDIDGIIGDELPRPQREALNEYHKRVYEALSPHMEYSEARWLRSATRRV